MALPEQVLSIALKLVQDRPTGDFLSPSRESKYFSILNIENILHPKK
ncbi:hypothetical protein ACSJMR_12230 [Acinetobacter pecorum]